MESEPTITHWIDQLKAGEQQAAQNLWEHYFQKLVQLARRRLRGAPRSHSDEEDIALSAFDSFCRAVEQGEFPQLHDRDDLWKLLVVITERKALNQMRDQRRLKRGGGKMHGESDWPDADGGQGFAFVAGREPSPAFAALVAEQCQRLLETLGDDVLRKLALHKMEGYSNAEIAQKMDLALRTVERKLNLIRQMWSQELDDR